MYLESACLDFLSGRAWFSCVSSWIPGPREASVQCLITGDPTSWSPAWGPAGPCSAPLPHLPIMALSKALSLAAGLRPDLQTGRSRLSLVLLLCGPVVSLSLTPRPFLQVGPLALLSDQLSSPLVCPLPAGSIRHHPCPPVGPRGLPSACSPFAPCGLISTQQPGQSLQSQTVPSLPPPSQHQGLCAGRSLCLECFSL